MELLGIPATTIVQGGLGTFGLLSMLLILTGRLIPIRTHDREMSAEAKRGDDWRAAYQAESARADEVSGQLAQILSAVQQRQITGRQR